MEIKCIPCNTLGTNCYIVSCPQTKQGVVIDAGGNAEQIMQYVQATGLEIQFVFCTHGHFDHILAAPQIKQATNAPIVIHAEDAPAFTQTGAAGLPKNMGFAPPDILAADGHSVTVGSLVFDWLHTPGHTRGSCTIRCEDALFTGDTLFFEECGRCDLEGGSYPTMLQSLQKLAGLSGEYRVYAGHDRSSTLSHERAHNPYMLEATR